MGAFNYTALDAAGKEKKGVMQGDTPRQIRHQLREEGLTPLEVVPVHTKNRVKTSSGDFFTRKTITSSELALLTRQLATLFAAGFPVEESLLTTSEQSEKGRIKSVLLAVRARVMEGHSLAVGLSDFPNIFPEIYRATIAAGENSGHLDLVLNRLADYVEQQQRMRQKIQQALIYPSVLTVVSIAIVGFLLAFVVPKMVSIFLESGQQLPLLTQILINLSNNIGNYGIYIAIMIFLGIFAFKYALRSNNVRNKVHSLLLKIPFFGHIIKSINTARFSRTFGILSSAGVSVLEAMDAASGLISILPMRDSTQKAALRVREGMPIHLALKETGYFSPMSIHLIASGEASGQLEDMLERSADTQDNNVSMLIESSLSLFEPMMILFMGAIVLMIVLAILLPIFAMNELVI